jgi:hypothetical protein
MLILNNLFGNQRCATGGTSQLLRINDLGDKDGLQQAKNANQEIGVPRSEAKYYPMTTVHKE